MVCINLYNNRLIPRTNNSSIGNTGRSEYLLARFSIRATAESTELRIIRCCPKTVRWYASFLEMIYEILRSADLQKKGNNASLLARLLEENEATGGSSDDVEIIKEVAATTYTGKPMRSGCQISELKKYT